VKVELGLQLDGGQAIPQVTGMFTWHLFNNSFRIYGYTATYEFDFQQWLTESKGECWALAEVCALLLLWLLVL